MEKLELQPQVFHETAVGMRCYGNKQKKVKKFKFAFHKGERGLLETPSEWLILILILILMVHFDLCVFLLSFWPAESQRVVFE